MSTKILIATPTAHIVYPEYVKGLIDAIRYASKNKFLEIDYQFIRGYMVDLSRNQLSYDAIKGNYDYVLFVDSDTVIPQKAIKELVDFAVRNKIGVVAGWQRRRQNYDGLTETFVLDDDKSYTKTFNTKEIKEKGYPFEIKATGFGCTLVQVEILDALFKNAIPPFKFIKYPDGSSLSEDLYFCHNVREAMNEKIYVLPSVECKHIWTDTF